MKHAIAMVCFAGALASVWAAPARPLYEPPAPPQPPTGPSVKPRGTIAHVAGTVATALAGWSFGGESRHSGAKKKARQGPLVLRAVPAVPQ